MTFLLITVVEILLMALAASAYLATSPGFFTFLVLVIGLVALSFQFRTYPEFARRIQRFPMAAITIPVKIAGGILIHDPRAQLPGRHTISEMDLGAEVTLTFTPNWTGSSTIKRVFPNLSLGDPIKIGTELASMLSDTFKHYLAQIITNRGLVWDRSNAQHILFHLNQIANDLLTTLREQNSPLVEAGILAEYDPAYPDHAGPGVTSIGISILVNPASPDYRKSMDKLTQASVVGDTQRVQTHADADAIHNMMTTLGLHGLRIADALKRTKQREV